MDRLALSVWLRHSSAIAMPQTLARALEAFPFSRLQPNAVFQVRAVSLSEPPLEEQFLDTSRGGAEAMTAAAEIWKQSDTCFEVQAFWDLFQQTGREWKLAPAAVTISCFGPDFERDLGDDLRVDFGLESQFLPPGDAPGAFRMVQDNIRSLLRLVKDFESRFKLEKRLLWPESGGNFAERLAALLQDA